MEIMSMVDDMSKHAEKHVHIISDQVMRSMVKTNEEIANEGIAFELLYPKDVDLPKEYRAKKKGSIEVRLLDEVHFSLKSNEKRAGVVFPDLQGKFDYEFALVGDNHQFLKWADLLFDYYWQRAEPAF